MKDKTKSVQAQKLIEEIRSKTNEVIKDRRNANNIVSILEHIQHPSSNVQTVCIRSLTKIFVHFFSTKAFSSKGTSDKSPEYQFREWLIQRYQDTQKSMIELIAELGPDEAQLRDMCLNSFMELFKEEGLFAQEGRKQVPRGSLELLLGLLLTHPDMISSLSARWRELFAHCDVAASTLKYLKTQIREENNVSSCCEILLLMKIEEKTLILAPDEPKGVHKLFTEVWMQLLALELPRDLVKRVLMSIDQILSQVSSPVRLTDFLSRSFEHGGALSLLALSGIFQLMQKHNMDYPDFYGKLYSLLNTKMLPARFRSRFFFLLDKFLSSTHLPTYLVVAFAKRLAVMSIHSPPDVSLTLIVFIRNLLIRHASISCLVNRPDQAEIEHDPYLSEESELIKTAAMESSLWEVQTLQQHYYPGVSVEAETLRKPMPVQESLLGEWLEKGADEIWEKEPPAGKIAPLNHMKPIGLFDDRDAFPKELFQW